MLQFFLRKLKQLAPAPYRAASGMWRWHMDRQYEKVQAKVVERLGLRVASGPFEGMSYIGEAFYGPLDSKIIGAYEAELHSVIQRVLKTDYKILVDIGCAEGYYAVGFARAFADKKVYAFDSETTARELCRQLALENRVQDRVAVGGFADAETLNALPLGGGFLMCDCEGCEMDLIDPALIPDLRHCDLLIELHDFLNPLISPTIISRFDKTHDIEIIASKARDARDYPSVSFLSKAQQKLAVSDQRWKPDQWAFMTVKQKTKACKETNI